MMHSAVEIPNNGTDRNAPSSSFTGERSDVRQRATSALGRRRETAVRNPGTLGCRIEIIESEREFFAIERDWEILRKRNGGGVIFQSWFWNWTWWQHLAPACSELCIIVCRNQDGSLAALAPFYILTYRFLFQPYWRQLRFLGTNPYVLTSEYLDILIAPGDDGHRAAGCIAQALRETIIWDSYWLAFTQPQSATSRFLIPVLEQYKHDRDYTTSFSINTEGRWREYIGKRGKKTRKNFRYLTRRILDRGGSKFLEASDEQEQPLALEALAAFHKTRWLSTGSLGAFVIPGFESFLKSVLREYSTRNQLKIWTLRRNNTINAVLVAFVEKGTAFAFQMGFHSMYAKDSLGFVLLGLCIRACFDDPTIRCMDLLSGGAQFKGHWTSNQIIRVTYSGWKSGGRCVLYFCVEHAWAMVKKILRATLPLPLLLWAKARLWKLRRTR